MESSVLVFINSLVFMALLCLSLKSYYTPDFLFQLPQLSKHGDHDQLDSVLSKASMADNTVIIAIVNKAYVEGDYPMLDLFLDSFKYGDDTMILFSHLIIVAVDQTSFEKCKFLRLVHCYKLETDGVDFEGEKLYMSEDFIRMMWRRTMFLGEVLKRGYNFVFTDTDVIWLRNPFPRLSKDQNIDLQISTDSFNGDPRSEANIINTGFYMARSNNKTISLFDAWFARKENSTGMKEQDVLQRMIQEGVFQELKLGVRFLDTLYFSGFCEVSKDFEAVTTVHANCCRTISAKLIDLRIVINDWKRFRSLTFNTPLNVRNITSTSTWSKHFACEDSWKN